MLPAFTDRFAAFLQQLFAHGIGELLARKTQEAVFLRVDQASDTVVLEHQMVFFQHLFARDVFREREFVTNQFEYQRITRQRKYRHHHAAFAIGMGAVLFGMFPEITKEMPVTFGLALLGTAQHGIDLVDWFARQ